MSFTTRDSENLLSIISHLVGVNKKSKDEIIESTYSLLNTRKFSTFYQTFGDILKAFFSVTKKPTSKGHIVYIQGNSGVLQIENDQETGKIIVNYFE
jgi:hypothetical protein